MRYLSFEDTLKMFPTPPGSKMNDKDLEIKKLQEELDVQTKAVNFWMTEAIRLQKESIKCSLSWGGFILEGDEKSIAEASRMLHESNSVPELKQRIKELSK